MAMMLIKLFLLSISLFSLATEAAALTKIAPNSTIGSPAGTPSTGALPAGTSQAAVFPSRPEINSFATSGAAFDLYILSLLQLQKVNQTDPLSYFQIAGIHGLPKIPWDGVVGQGPLAGYCMHACVAFPLWHRPYLALFEQAIWSHAQTIATAYPPEERQRYQRAALSLRIPYWDWAIHPELPQVVTTPTIIVNDPTGRVEIPNPLYQYVFHPGPEGNGFPADHLLSDARFTTRYSDAQLKQSDETAATASMLSNAASTLSLTYQLLTSINDYSQFATTNPGEPTVTANNIENIHNGVHNRVGGNQYGSMWWPEFAAFDPIFWLHHTQVDRLLAIWQELNPSNYIVPRVNTYGTYYEMPGTVDLDTSALAPFHSNNDSTMSTPNSVRRITDMGYTYPELEALTGTIDQQQAQLRSRINSLYNSPPNTTVTTRAGEEDIRAKSLTSAFGHVTLRTAQQLRVNNLERQWSIRITLQQSVLTRPLDIHFFMGTPPSDVEHWSTANNLIGTYSQFIPADLLAPYRALPGFSQGEISLTHSLAAGRSRGYSDDLSPEQVVPLLQDYLQWKARTPDNQEICLEEIGHQLEVTVQSRSVNPSNTMDEFPTYGPIEFYPEATLGKVIGGCRMNSL